MAFNPALYLTEIKRRLQNPAVSDDELTSYLIASSRDVRENMYSKDDYDNQILDTCCHLLAIDNKFPEIQSVSSAGVSTTFSQNDPKRFLDRVNKRRSAYWMR